MNKKWFFLHPSSLLAPAVFTFYLSLSGQTIDLTGKIVDGQGIGIENAVLHLKTADIKDTTDAGGEFHLTNGSVRIGGKTATPVPVAVAISHQTLFLTVNGKLKEVRIDAFSPSGKLVGSVIKSGLEKGVSTKASVRSLLGEPDGFGNSTMPPDHKPNEIWFKKNLNISEC